MGPVIGRGRLPKPIILNQLIGKHFWLIILLCLSSCSLRGLFPGFFTNGLSPRDQWLLWTLGSPRERSTMRAGLKHVKLHEIRLWSVWTQCKLHIAHAAGSPAGSWALLGDQTGNHSFVLGKAERASEVTLPKSSAGIGQSATFCYVVSPCWKHTVGFSGKRIGIGFISVNQILSCFTGWPTVEAPASIYWHSENINLK